MLWEYVDLTNWTTKEQILKELKKDFNDINERAFRKSVELQNSMYAEHQSNTFIAHSNKGYKIAVSEEEIRNSARDYRARAMDQLVKYSKIMKALGENANVSFEIINGELMLKEL